ncbi:MAG TPA: phenylacetate--CoA ligase [Methanomassiliicoccales archaeon]|nr:phenylacetate--CoA ligase [Methanomassiliicoccales archaeon]HQQ25130.1 phenylacetate--CoA ligase [Methanomassiliicoccales archaeon]
MDVWNPHIEKLPKAQLDALQLKLLKIQTRRMWERSPFYRERMRSAGVTPDDIRTLRDVRRLPFMTKKDLRDGYPNKLMMRDRGDLLRYHASSGTTGKATIVGYTKNDLENWSESLARAMTSFGLGKKDIIQVANTYGLFSGGLGFHYATEKIGATVIPASTGNTDRQLELICDLGVTAMAATPSYLMYLGEVAEKKGIDIRRDTQLRYGLLGGEPWSDRMRDRIYEKMGIKGFNCFGASELSGPLFMECAEQDGIHFWGDLALLEIVDPETGEPLEPGQKGEMVVTMLQKEAFPMMRYRMGDITSIMEEPCPCGRAHPRITRIQGRVDDMIIIRGINVFPSQVEHSLMQHSELGNEFQLVVDRKGHLDTMLVRAELKPEAFTDNIIELNALRERISNRLKNVLNVSANVELVQPGTLPRFEGKAKRVMDRREY